MYLAKTKSTGRIFTVLTLIFLLITFSLSVYAQETDSLSFPDIKEILLTERPQSGDSLIRHRAFLNIDRLVNTSYNATDIGDFLTFMVEKAILEIEYEAVTEGATIWQIYNHGFVVKTASVCMGFDLTERFTDLSALAELIDVLFISHSHKDHYSRDFISRMNDLGKAVIGPAETSNIGTNVLMNAGEEKTISQLLVNAHFGLHSKTVIQFEITTPEGLKILHTGDNQTSQTIPELSDINILLLNAWVNESGLTHHITGVRKAINKVKPDVCLPGHILELAHVISGGYAVPYRDALEVSNISLPSEYCVLAWGERYHYPGSANDTIKPNPINNPQDTIVGNTIRIDWNAATEALDGDTSVFYRLIRENNEEFFLLDNFFSFPLDSTGIYPFQIYSYDQTGNQSEDYVTLNVNISDTINYPPMVRFSYPANQDTIDVFSGVQRVFQAEAFDLNHDSLSFSWTFNRKPIPESWQSSFLYNMSGIDPGMYSLILNISDNKLDMHYEWLLKHYSDSAVVDDQDTLMFFPEESWSSNNSASSIRGSFQSFRYSGISSSAAFVYYPESEGAYHVYVFVPEYHIVTNKAKYTVLVNDVELDSIYLDQMISAGKWNRIGRFDFPENSTVEVRVSNGADYIDHRFVLADAVSFKYAWPLGINESQIPSSIDHILLKPYPNPLRSKMYFEIRMAERSEIDLRIYNLLGKEIKTIVSGMFPAGEHKFEWDAENQLEGIYFYRFRSGNHMQSGTIVHGH